MIPIGEMRDQVIIEKATRTREESGGFTEAWEKFAAISAKVEERSGSQIQFSDQQQQRITHRVTARFLEGVTSDMRILWGTRVLQVQYSRNPDGKKKRIEIACEEGKAS